MNSYTPSGLLAAASFSAVVFFGAYKAHCEENPYEAGLRAFNLGRDMEAVESITRAAKENEGCLGALEDISIKSLPAACAETSAVSYRGDPAPLVLFQLGRLRWEDETRKLEAKGLLRKNQHSKDLFEKLIENHPYSAFTDDAALMLIEDSLCFSDEGYPDCDMLEIRAYENFLKTYPHSDRSAEVIFRMAELFMELSELHAPGESGDGRESRPWENKIRAELFLGQAKRLSLTIKENHPGSQEARKASTLLERINSSPLVPASIGEAPVF